MEGRVVVGDPLERERNPHAVRGRATKVVVKDRLHQARPAEAADPATMSIAISPSPSMPPVTASPITIGPTPAGVPAMIMSPRLSALDCDKIETISAPS